MNATNERANVPSGFIYLARFSGRRRTGVGGDGTGVLSLAVLFGVEEKKLRIPLLDGA